MTLSLKQAHWNVKGPHFIALHELFDKLYEEAGDHADTIAERIAALGGNAEGTTQAVVKKTTLAEYPLALTDGLGHVARLADSFAKFGGEVRRAIDTATELRDADTADLFTGLSRELDKSLWFLEAHIQK